jgi:hypothetical protein
MALWILLFKVPQAQAEEPASRVAKLYTSYVDDVGLALDKATPKRSVLFLDSERDPPDTFEVQDLMFWSGRMAYRRPPDLQSAQRAHYHPYLLSSLAQPYAPVPGVPAVAWARAYDLAAPAKVADLPPDLIPVHVQTAGLEVLGFATRALDGPYSRFAFYARPTGGEMRLTVRYHLKSGSIVVKEVSAEESLVSSQKLRTSAWFVIPELGPPLAKIAAVSFGDSPERFVVH